MAQPPGPGQFQRPGMRCAGGRAGAALAALSALWDAAVAGAGTGLVWEMGQRAGLQLALLGTCCCFLSVKGHGSCLALPLFPCLGCGPPSVQPECCS